jgi:hypothetical protein
VEKEGTSCSCSSPYDYEGAFVRSYSSQKQPRGKMKKVIAVFILFLIGMSPPVLASRPLVTDDFGIVDKGKFEIEAGSNSETPRAGGASAGSAALQVKYGALENFDLGLEVPYSFSDPVGLGDMTVKAKLKVLEFDENDGVAVSANLKLANADVSTGLGSGYLDYSANFIYSREISGYRTHYNVGYAFIGVPSGAAEANVINYSAAVEKEVYPGGDIVCEYYGTSASAGAAGNIQIGGRLQTSKYFRVDTGFSVAMNDNSGNVATIGVTAEF